MECRDAQFQLRLRRPGPDDLGPEVTAALDRHLAGCPHCREYLEQMRRTITVSGHLRDEDVPEDVVDALARAFTDFHQGR